MLHSYAVGSSLVGQALKVPIEDVVSPDVSVRWIRMRGDFADHPSPDVICESCDPPNSLAH